MSTSSNLLHSFRLPISHDNYQSIAVQYSGNHQSFCHSTQLDPALWLNAPLKRIKDGDFTIEATPLSLSKVANTPLSWKFDFKDTIGNATDIHKLQADISIKG
ncbi:MAG: hypothetical protein U9Q15_01555 [Patescibacteria group bacterium]|nr:hypothetical protein [Patescibacteria group bacterium]